MLKRHYLGFFLTFLLGAIGPLHGQSVTNSEKNGPPKARIQFSTKTKESRVGDLIYGTFQIENVGAQPFYITSTIRDLDDGNGGFDAVLIGPRNAQMISVDGGGPSFPPGYHRDIVRDVREHWLLLFPGTFYGGTGALRTIPMSPGAYKIFAKRNPPRMTEEEKERLRTELKYPVLVDNLESPVVSLVVVKEH
jgi:hypothetical protein